MQQVPEDLSKMKRSFYCGVAAIGCRELKNFSGDQLLEKLQTWLSPPDPSINQNIAHEAHHVGTAAWFIEGATYDEWKKTGSLLWIHGKRTISHIVPALATDSDLLFFSGIGQECALVRGSPNWFHVRSL
jgi:hypothetical protein